MNVKEKMKVADRLDGVGEYYFSKKLKEIEELNTLGKNVINLGIGSPDLPPHQSVINELILQSSKPDTHAYPAYRSSPVLRNAIAAWYSKWYGVNLNPATEILPTIGSKECILNICMTYLNKGDIALIPNPGYPTYSSAVKLAGGEIIEYNLEESLNWAPDFNELSGIVKASANPVKLMFANYPHMPTGAKPTKELFEDLVKFAHEHDILICHDNPYSFILNDSPMSLLSIAGAKEVAIELNSLSKSHNMAGWRVGMICGAEQRINEIIRFKSNMDSGLFLPIQLAAAKALELDENWFEALNNTYKTRRTKVYELLTLIGCSYDEDQSGLFVWARCPEQNQSGYKVCDDYLYGSGVFITPGGIFGSAGENYIRISLCSSVEKLEEAIQRIKNFMS